MTPNQSSPTAQTEPMDFGKGAQATWNTILQRHQETRERQVIDLFQKGIDLLEINSEVIPDLNRINKKLSELTGFQGVFVDGLEDGNSFYTMLANRQFPIGSFIREAEDLSYTPEPDVVHDLYGHLPFFTNKEYSDFCQQFGERACQFLDREDLLRQFERFFWFTIEFGLIKTSSGIRVFGAGIASSTAECEYALSATPEVVPFDVDVIRKQEFRIDKMQERLFLIENTEQLYSSLNYLSAQVEQDR